MLSYPKIEGNHKIPILFMIGAAKSGTTTLASLLAQHPLVQLGTQKEPEFFSHHFDKGLDWYSSNFSPKTHNQLYLDASTSYTRLPQYPDTAERIKYYSPDAKLIYLMRHPVDRAYSHFVHRFTKELHYNSYFNTTFEEHIKKDPMCIDSSNYKLQIEEYLKYFPMDQLLLLFSHDLGFDKLQVVKKVCKFIDIDFKAQYFLDIQANQNVTTGFIESRVRVKITDQIKAMPGIRKILPFIPSSLKQQGYTAIRKLNLGNSVEKRLTAPPMLSETRERLINEFQPSNNWIAELSGTDLSLWNK